MRVLKTLVRWLFASSGWRIVGEIPNDLKKAVLVGGPHTSNWDLFYTLGLMYTLEIPFRFVIKKEAMVFPIKSLLNAFGAYPVERNKPGSNLVEQISKVFEESEECFLCIAPEGTRTATSDWKTGFYHIAKRAQVPILVGYLDRKNKSIHMGSTIDTSLSETEAMKLLSAIMSKANPEKPKNFQLPEI